MFLRWVWPLLAAAASFPPVDSLPVQPGLADPFRRADGSRIADRSQWPQHREYLKDLLAHYQYGRMPPKPDFTIVEQKSRTVYGGDGLQETFVLRLSRGGKTVDIRAGIVRPNRTGRFPVIVKNDEFVFSLDDIRDPRTRAAYEKDGRGTLNDRVSQEAVRRGYAICKFIRTDVAADRKENRASGVFPLYPEKQYDFGTIAAWAWAYQPLIDHLLRQPWVHADRIVSTGHSRGGKTALCAGIYEERIAIAAPSASGSGGTGSWRFQEPDGANQTVGLLWRQQPHWFGPGLEQFIDHEDRLPFDGHTARAAVAPRALFNSQGSDDKLSNKLGTQAAFEAAQVLFEWLGQPRNQALVWRPGGHGQYAEDWDALFDFCDAHFFGKSPKRDFQQMPHPGQKRFFNWTAPSPWPAR